MRKEMAIKLKKDALRNKTFVNLFKVSESIQMNDHRCLIKECEEIL